MSTLEVLGGRTLTGELRVMDATGDSRTIWDPANAEEVAAVKRTFDDLRKKGFLAFAVKKDGEKGKQITEFDPTAGKLILAPQMAGG